MDVGGWQKVLSGSGVIGPWFMTLLRDEVLPYAVKGPSQSWLLMGETGVGKEKVAEVIAGIQGATLRPVNCAGFTEALLDGELFGHVKGAFTGATKDRPGLMRAAADAGDVLFLDEIGEMPEHLQAKLLRALETGRARRVGEDEEEKVGELTVVAATNKHRRALRDDLFFRFERVVRIPPLRERTADAVALIGHFIRENGGPVIRISRDLLGYLLQGIACEPDDERGVRNGNARFLRQDLIARCAAWRYYRRQIDNNQLPDDLRFLMSRRGELLFRLEANTPVYYYTEGPKGRLVTCTDGNVRKGFPIDDDGILDAIREAWERSRFTERMWESGTAVESLGPAGETPAESTEEADTGTGSTVPPQLIERLERELATVGQKGLKAFTLDQIEDYAHGTLNPETLSDEKAATQLHLLAKRVLQHAKARTEDTRQAIISPEAVGDFEAMERRYFRALFEQCDKRKDMAATAGLDATTIDTKLKKYFGGTYTELKVRGVDGSV